MTFSSLPFLAVFLPVFLLLYLLLPSNRRLKNMLILAASIVFYSWGGPRFIFVILGVTFLDYHFVRQMHAAASQRRRRLWLTLSLTMNVGLLLYFKYFNFFIDNINLAGSLSGLREIQVARILLPIGISFYTFESITYVVDVYRRVHAPLNNFWDYQLYILFFPKLIAGPIVRYYDIADQIQNHVGQETHENRVYGLSRFFIGLGKKVLIANVVGAQANAVFALPPEQLNTAAIWIGALAYTFQIYFDFSGYSDMAIGLGRIMGFRLPENFNSPYTATSITDFWRRWHITLGTWMRTYIYIPLGGNRVTPVKMYRNLFIVFLASGLWHGASWNFVLWGAYHGLFLILDRLFLYKLLARIGRFPATALTFVVVVTGWVLFRVENLQQAFGYIRRMFVFDFNPNLGIIAHTDFKVVVWIAAFFSFFASTRYTAQLQDRIFEVQLRPWRRFALTITTLFLFGLSLTYVSASSFNPFIYFKF